MPRGDLIVEFGPPVQGVSTDLPARLPPNQVRADTANNVYVQDGKLVSRPGMRALCAAVSDASRPMGLYFYKDGSTKRTVLGTGTKLWAYSGSAWTDITGSTALSGDANDHVRFTSWPTAAGSTLISVNSATEQVPQKWTGTGTAADLGGSPPAAQDITVAGNRVVLFRTYESGAEKFFRVRWSAFNDHETWSAANFVDLVDTPDPVVGGRALTRTAMAIYKEASQWVGLITTGTYPFKFELQDQKPGPVSAAAIVAAEGRHYYFGLDGNLFAFDGNRCAPIGDAVRRHLTTTLDYTNADRTFGFYYPANRTIFWVYQAVGDSDPQHAVSLHLDTGAIFLHRFAYGLSCGVGWDTIPAITWGSLSGYTWGTIALTYPTWASFGSGSSHKSLVGQTTGLVHQFGATVGDNGNAYSCRWQFGPAPLAGPGKAVRLESMENFFEDTGASLTVSLSMMTSDTQTSTDQTAIQTDTFDMDQGTTVFLANYTALANDAGSGTPETRFVGPDFSVADVRTVEFAWLGGVLRGYRQETETL